MDHFSRFFEKQYGEPLDRALDKAGISIGRLLNNLGLARDATLNLAGLLVFGRNPQRHRPAFVMKAVSFVGNDPTGDRYRDSQDIEGCLQNLHKGTMSFLTRNLQRLQGEKGFNTEGDLEVPPSLIWSWNRIMSETSLRCAYPGRRKDEGARKGVFSFLTIQ